MQWNGHGHDEEEGSGQVAMRSAAAACIGETGCAHPDEGDQPSRRSDRGRGECGDDQGDGGQAPGKQIAADVTEPILRSTAGLLRHRSYPVQHAACPPALRASWMGGHGTEP